MTKKEMRKKMLSLRDSLSEKERREKSRVIAKRLFTLEEFQKAEVVLSYQSFRSEVETTEMNQKIRESGKSLYLPKTYADRKEMAFYRVYSDADLIPGYQGILEPQEKEPFTEKLASLKPEKVLMLMPGAAFDVRETALAMEAVIMTAFYRRWGDILETVLCWHLKCSG